MRKHEGDGAIKSEGKTFIVRYRLNEQTARDIVEITGSVIGRPQDLIAMRDQTDSVLHMEDGSKAKVHFGGSYSPGSDRMPMQVSGSIYRDD